MWRNRERLAEQGYAFPGRPVDHFRAALDLREIDFGGYDDPLAEGAWEPFAAEALKSARRGIVVSHEVLAAASSEQIGTAVRSFAPADVHVVCGARDLARQLPAVWQESLKNRRVRPYRKFLKVAFKDQPTGSPARFWVAQDPTAVLARWGEHIPPERLHLVTVPQRRTSEDTLWRRFCTAVDLDATGFDLDVARANTSLSQPASEVLRRLNAVLPEDLDWPAYERQVKLRFNRLAERGLPGDRLTVPRRLKAQVLARSERIRAELAASPYDIVGDLDDLIPSDDAFGSVQDPNPEVVTETAVAILAELLLEQPPRGAGAPHRARSVVHRLRRKASR